MINRVLCLHHQNTKWGYSWGENAVHPSCEATEMCGALKLFWLLMEAKHLTETHYFGFYFNFPPSCTPWTQNIGTEMIPAAFWHFDSLSDQPVSLPPLCMMKHTRWTFHLCKHSKHRVVNSITSVHMLLFIRTNFIFHSNHTSAYMDTHTHTQTSITYDPIHRV